MEEKEEPISPILTDLSAFDSMYYQVFCYGHTKFTMFANLFLSYLALRTRQVRYQLVRMPYEDVEVVFGSLISRRTFTNEIRALESLGAIEAPVLSYMGKPCSHYRIIDPVLVALHKLEKIPASPFDEDARLKKEEERREFFGVISDLIKAKALFSEALKHKGNIPVRIFKVLYAIGITLTKYGPVELDSMLYGLAKEANKSYKGEFNYMVLVHMLQTSKGGMGHRNDLVKTIKMFANKPLEFMSFETFMDGVVPCIKTLEFNYQRKVM